MSIETEAPPASGGTYTQSKEYQTEMVRKRINRWNKEHEARLRRSISPMRVSIDLFDHKQADGRLIVLIHGDGSKPTIRD